jgi:hypothetical protein
MKPLCAALCLLLAGSALFAEDKLPTPTIFMVNGEPEKYEGQTVLFDKAVLLGPSIKRGDKYELQVGNERAAKPDSLTFSLSRKLANKLAELGRLPENQPVQLTCKIEKRGAVWHAHVQQIALLGEDGKPTQTFKEE